MELGRGPIPHFFAKESCGAPFGAGGGGRSYLGWRGWMEANIDSLNNFGFPSEKGQDVDLHFFFEEGILTSPTLGDARTKRRLFVLRDDKKEQAEIPLVLDPPTFVSTHFGPNRDICTMFGLAVGFDGHEYAEEDDMNAKIVLEINVPQGTLSLLRRVDDHEPGAIEKPDGWFYFVLETYLLIHKPI